MKKHIQLSVALAVAAAVTNALPLARAEATESDVLRERVHALEQELTAITKRLDGVDQTAATAPKVSLSDKGISLASADNAYAIKFRGVAQFDSRLFFDDGGVSNNSFLLRRARIISEGVFAKYFSFQFVPEFGGSSVSILDASIGVTLNKSIQLKFGKFTPPLGLERLQGVCWTFFNEASLVSNLVPVRDVGVQASGLVANGTVNYALGVFGGVADNGSSSNSDFDNDKDLIARVFASPFKNGKEASLKGLSLGVAASLGRSKTTAGRTAGYKTDGQQTFFSYAAGTTADGRTWRVAPQLDYRWGSFGALGEYVISAVNVRQDPATDTTRLENKSWQFATGYVLTGEQSSYTGVVPRNNFDLAAGTWGAFEVVARYADLNVDSKAFPLFASSAANAKEASSVGLGFNWYLSKVVLFSTDYYQTHFGFSSSAPAVPTTQILRQDEQALIMRVQIAF